MQIASKYIYIFGFVINLLHDHKWYLSGLCLVKYTSVLSKIGLKISWQPNQYIEQYRYFVYLYALDVKLLNKNVGKIGCETVCISWIKNRFGFHLKMVGDRRYTVCSSVLWCGCVCFRNVAYVYELSEYLGFRLELSVLSMRY